MKNTEEKKMKSVHVGADCFPLDRISKLPDDILVDILSTLEFRESAKTSVLSRRWLNLWTLVPCLHFDATKDQHGNLRPIEQWEQDMPVFVNWVNHVLDLHKSSDLQEFIISLRSVKCYQNEIDKWLEYAFGKGVERLELKLSRCPFRDVKNENTYVFPNRLLEQTTNLRFSCVRALYLSLVNISGEAIELLLLKCPLLEDLRVTGSGVPISLVVSGPSLLLKHLHIIYSSVKSITISNTNIISLRVSILDKGHLLLNRLPKLTEVWINGLFSDKSILFSQLSCCLSQLTVLTLQTLFPETIMELYKFPELPNLRRLVLIAYCCDHSLIGLTSLIDSCPRLEEFALKFHPVKANMLKIEQLHSMNASRSKIEQKKAMEQSLKGLKVFELCGYHGLYANQSELIMFFIENAVALEKIIIDPREVTTCHGSEPVETEQAMEFRRHAIENFSEVVPKHVELVVL